MCRDDAGRHAAKRYFNESWRASEGDAPVRAAQFPCVYPAPAVAYTLGGERAVTTMVGRSSAKAGTLGLSASSNITPNA